MTFEEASEQLKRCPTDEDLAGELGVGVQSIRQARLDETSPSYRSPPGSWPAGIARLARARAAQLLELAEHLESADEEAVQ